MPVIPITNYFNLIYRMMAPDVSSEYARDAGEYLIFVIYPNQNGLL